MEATDWQQLLTMAGALGAGGLISGVIVYLFFRSYFSTYLEEKAKNLATREDLERLTRITEEVRSEYQARHSLRFAALDKRLQANQEAYSIAMQLAGSAQFDKESRRTAAERYRKWWPDNCLYLEAPSREALKQVYEAFSRHPALERSEQYDSLDCNENWDRMWKASERIAEAIGLPPLTSQEKLDVQQSHAGDVATPRALG